jgi:hypothetical protein
MAAVNMRRVALGAVAGWVIWGLWSTFINLVVLGSRYEQEAKSGHLLSEPRYKLFLLYWFLALFVISWILAGLYASVRATRGAGPKTALTLGLAAGFAIAFPVNLTLAAFAPFDRILPLGWMLDLWVGSILATLVAGFLYREST